MNCEEMLALISGHMDGEISQEEQLRLREHLAECVSCNQLLKELQTNDALLAEMEEELPIGLCDAIMARIRNERSRTKRNFRIWSSLTASAAAVALLLGAGTLLLPKGSSDGSVIGIAEPQEAESVVYCAEKSLSDTISFDCAAEEAVIEEAAMEDAVEEAAPAEAPMEQKLKENAYQEPQMLADRLGGVVVYFNEAVEKLQIYALQMTEDGVQYYLLNDAAEAEELCQAYGGVLFWPEETTSQGAYALVHGG